MNKTILKNVHNNCSRTKIRENNDHWILPLMKNTFFNWRRAKSETTEKNGGKIVYIFQSEILISTEHMTGSKNIK